MTDLGIALISYAHSHGEKWGQALGANPRAELVGAWDDDIARGTASSAALGVPYFTDLDALLSDPRVTAVAITSEHGQHVDHIVAAAEAGKHILCEKPVAARSADLDRARRAIAASGVRYMQGLHMRLDPAHQTVRGLVRGGGIGTLSSAWLRHNHDFGLVDWPHGVHDWYLDKTRAGGGSGLDEMIHACDWMRWVFGEPTSVTAEYSNHVLRQSVEDNITATYRVPGGALVAIQSSWTVVGGLVTHEIAGTEGTILQVRTDISASRAPDPIGAPILYARRGDREWRRPEVESTFNSLPHHRVADEFIRCLLDGGQFPSGIEDGIRATEMVLAAYQSAETGRRVEIPQACEPVEAATYERSDTVVDRKATA
jgi:myo-inositol 2-dehydrogenase / D-chiro-inositol 1-dehydrogenase